MHNLLIVDDETEILEWLEELFRYECQEELEIYTAGSGKKAISILNEIKCDVVLTDIKMPGMNGMELYRHIKENWPRAKVVFLTGYRDHEALYEVVLNREVRYLLKTEGDKRILETVMDAVEELRRDMDDYEVEERRHALFKKAKYWLQKEFVDRLIQGTEKVEITQSILEEMEIPFKYEYPVLLFLGKIEEKETRQFYAYENHETILSNIIENMPKILRIYACILEQSYVLLMIQPKIVDEYTDWKRIFHISRGALEDIQQISISHLKIKLPFTVSSRTVRLEELGGHYYRLKNRLITILHEAEPGILTVDGEIWEPAALDTKAVLGNLSVLNSYLERGCREECLRTLGEMTKPLLSVESRHDMGALELYYNISMVFLKYINLNRLQDKVPFHIALYKLTGVEDFRDWTEAADYLKELCGVLFTLMGEESGYHRDLVMEKIEEYIRQNLKNELTLNVLSEVSGFNASYLSRIFKQKYHCNLSEFIVKERMLLAKRYLAETNEKVNRIGEEAGYPSPHSFTRVFKNSEGMSPVEYRNKYQK